MHRREFLKANAAWALAAVGGCRTILPATKLGTSIDAHCHVFNASDLPAVRFIRYVFLEKYPETDRVQLLDVHDPDVLDRLLELFVKILGANRAPTAAAETAVLDARSDVELTHKDFDTAAEIAVGAVGRYIEERLSDTLARCSPRQIDAEQKLLSALFEAAGTTRVASDTPLGASGARSVAAGAFRSSADMDLSSLVQSVHAVPTRTLWIGLSLTQRTRGYAGAALPSHGRF